MLSIPTLEKTTRLKHLPSYLKILFNFRMTGFKSSLNNDGKEYVVTNAKCADSSKGLFLSFAAWRYLFCFSKSN